MRVTIGPNRVFLILVVLGMLGAGLVAAGCMGGGGQEEPNGFWTEPTEWEPENVSNLKRVTQRLVPPPNLPEHEQVSTGEPKVVEVRMVVEE